MYMKKLFFCVFYAIGYGEKFFDGSNRLGSIKLN